MADTAPTDAHEWVSFSDPDEDRTWLIDVTFLSSPWRCLYGDGCQGVLEHRSPEIGHGCCTYGAHFSDDADRARVDEAVAKLAPNEWQFREEGLDGGYVESADGSSKTVLVDGACIFLNRSGYPGGQGCALHLAAERLGIAHRAMKPDVCWQLPLRREDTVDDRGHVTSRVHEWRRIDWGEAGEDFAWWCTESPEAFTATEPVVDTLAEELRGLVGDEVYALVCSYLDERSGRQAVLPHPTVRSRLTPLGES